MISLDHHAIICTASNLTKLKIIEELLGGYFGKQYVIEISEDSLEVMALIDSLHDVGVETSLVITDDVIRDMDGYDLSRLLGKRYPQIKVMLMTSRADIDYAQKIVNNNCIYALAKWPIVKDHFIQLVENACRQFTTDKELSGLLVRLRMSEEEKSLILESISEAIIYVDMEGRVQWKNHVASTDLFDACKSEADVKAVLNHFCNRNTFNQVFSATTKFSAELQLYDRIHIARYFPVYDKDRVAAGMVMTFLDITDRKKVMDMNNSLLEMSKYINDGDALVLIYNKAFNLIDKYFSIGLMCITGEDYDNDYVEYYGEKSREMAQTNVDELIRSVKKIVHNNLEKETIMMKNELGTILAYPMYGRLLLLVIKGEMDEFNDGLNYINTIAEHIKLGILKTENYRKIVYQANHDSLTGLFSRDYFMKRLANHLFSHRKEAQTKGFYSLGVLDLNYFKDVNDNLSHLVGDEVLLEIAQRLNNALREGDVVARIGGDEFGILFQAGHRKEITGLIERLQREIAEPIKVDDIGISIGSSFGIVYDISGYNSEDQLLGDADQAMYEAKKDKSGIGTYVFYETKIQNRVAHQRHMEYLLKSADFTKELNLSYQPIIRISDMSVVGYEGFARWHAEDGKDYKPSEFINIADESGDILRIGTRVIDLAIESLEKMNNANQSDCYVTINLSPNQIVHDEYIRQIKRKMTETTLGNHRLHIDMNDGIKSSQMDRTFKNIQELKDYGIHIEMDDFSRGNVGIQMINHLGVNQLKIDRDTIREINDNKEAMNLIKSILSVAKSLNMKVTAEGVEKAEELETLKELGCDFAQGYYFMHPGTLDSAMAYSTIKR